MGPKKAVYHYRDQMQCTLPINAVLQGENKVYIYKYFEDLKKLKSNNSLKTFIPEESFSYKYRFFIDETYIFAKKTG